MKVTRNTAASLFAWRPSRRNSSHSPIRYATTSNTAPSTVSGMNFASGAASRTTTRSVSAWIMPATGEVAPLRTLVAVRASTPVTGMHPKKGTVKLARPCAISSWFESCRSSIMPSATTAESSDSIAPIIVMAMAGATRLPRCDQSNTSGCSAGRPLGNASGPKRPVMVMTGSRNARTVKVPRMTATIEPGTKRAQAFGQSVMRAAEASPTATVGPLSEGSARTSAGILSKNSAGTVPSCRPRKSFTCVSMIVIAMPQVKPVVTGCGMNLISVPSRAAPKANKNTPDMAVQIRRLGSPYCRMIAYTSPTKAPAGPPICTREPPRAETMNPPMIAV